MISLGSAAASAEVCAHVKKIGYSVSKKIRIYGEDFAVLSDPYLTEEGVSIEVCSVKTLKFRVLTLPATLLPGEFPKNRSSS